MKRRYFIQRLLSGLTGVLLGGMAPGPVSRVLAAENEGEKLHFRPLNGRNLRELAARRKHHGGDQFVNPVGIDRSGRFWQLLEWKLFRPNRFKDQLENQRVKQVQVDWRAVEAHRQLSVTFLKHASLLIKDRGRYLLIDPVFSDLFWFIKDFSPLDTAAMPAVDDILITHGHYDHLDTATLETMPSGTHVVTPLGYNDIFTQLKMGNRTQLDWYGSCRAADAEVTLLPCNHWTMRNPLEGPNRSLWGSYLIRTGAGMTIYVSGDTAYFDGFEQLGADYDIDLAIFNLGAYEPRWFMAPSHTNPAETVRAFRDLNADKLMIVHWGTFRLGDEPVFFPPRDIRTEMQKAGLMDRLISLQHGQTLFL